MPTTPAQIDLWRSSATVEAGLIKAEDEAAGSRKFARYIPFWA